VAPNSAFRLVLKTAAVPVVPISWHFVQNGKHKVALCTKCRFGSECPLVVGVILWVKWEAALPIKSRLPTNSAVCPQIRRAVNMLELCRARDNSCVVTGPSLSNRCLNLSRGTKRLRRNIYFARELIRQNPSSHDILPKKGHREAALHASGVRNQSHGPLRV
jgi:hypothetical protein